MMPGRIILGMAASPSIPWVGSMPESGTPGKLPGARRLFLRGGVQFGDAFRTDLMDDAAKFLDAFAELRQFLFADLVMLGIAGLGIGFLQFLEHRALAAIALGRSEEHTSELQSLM